MPKAVYSGVFGVPDCDRLVLSAECKKRTIAVPVDRLDLHMILGSRSHFLICFNRLRSFNFGDFVVDLHLNYVNSVPKKRDVCVKDVEDDGKGILDGEMCVCKGSDEQ